MPRFRQEVTGHYIIYVDAEDAYDADTIISNMTQEEFLSKIDSVETYHWDTSELPEEC